MPSPPRLVLFARYPTPGAAKTRLIPAIGADGAARIHRRLTERTAALLVAGGCPVELHYTGADAADFKAWLGHDIALVRQPEGDLTARLLAAIAPAPVIFFGADTPELRATHIAQAVSALATHDAVIGPASDGGYYLIGIARALPELFTDMAWSTDAVFPETLRRLETSGMTAAILETLDDCDRPEDLARWPWLAT